MIPIRSVFFIGIMSVSVPIYQRILYGSPAIRDGKEKQVLSPGEEDQSSEPHDSLVIATNANEMSPCEMLDSNRNAFSALSIHKESQIIPRAVSAPAISFNKSTRKQSPQYERWKERKQNLAHSRTIKQKSNIIVHRQDKGYYIAGSKVPLIDRYDIDEEELIRLRMLAHSRADKSTRASSVNSSVLNQRRRIGSPSGQNSSPVPPPTVAVEAEKRKNILDRRNELKDDRVKRKEMIREQRQEKAKRREEKMKFENEMAEKYKPKKPEKKSLIFLTEQSEIEKKHDQRVFLTESDFMIDEEEKGLSTYSFVNEKQRLAFSSIFNEMDKNQDGRIDIDELKQNLFPLASKENLKHLLQVFDVNKDHMVEIREFITICALNDQLCGTRTESGTTSLALDLERLAKHITIYKELFAVIDEDRNGHIQTDEILLMITTAVAGDEKVDEEEARRVLNNMEKDEKGHIDFTSFMSYIPFFAKLLQVIMDSPLSIKNLEQARDRVMRKYSRSPEETA